MKIENPLRAEFAASEQRLQRAIRDNGHRSNSSVVGSEWLFSSEAAIGRKSLIWTDNCNRNWADQQVLIYRVYRTSPVVEFNRT